MQSELSTLKNKLASEQLTDGKKLDESTEGNNFAILKERKEEMEQMKTTKAELLKAKKKKKKINMTRKQQKRWRA